MRIVRRYSILFFSCLLLAGCGSSQSAEQYQQVEESIVTQENTEKNSESEKDTIGSDDVTEYGNDEELQDQFLVHYVPDSHFYETTPQPCMQAEGMLNLEILEAFASKNPADGGEYFTTSERLQQLKEWGEEDGEDTILFVKIRLTNPQEHAVTVAMSDFYMYKRVPGSPKEKNEFSDQKISGIHDELDFDKPMTLGDSIYYVKLEAGETMETTLAYYVVADDLKEKLYMQCYGTGGANWSTYNAEKSRQEPSNDVNMRYVRVHVKE